MRAIIDIRTLEYVVKAVYVRIGGVCGTGWSTVATYGDIRRAVIVTVRVQKIWRSIAIGVDRRQADGQKRVCRCRVLIIGVVQAVHVRIDAGRRHVARRRLDLDIVGDAILVGIGVAQIDDAITIGIGRHLDTAAGYGEGSGYIGLVEFRTGVLRDGEGQFGERSVPCQPRHVI